MNQNTNIKSLEDEGRGSYERICAVLSAACLAAARGELCRPDQETLTIEGQQWVHATASVLMRYVADPSDRAPFSLSSRERTRRTPKGLTMLLARWLRACGVGRTVEPDPAPVAPPVPTQDAPEEIPFTPLAYGLCMRCFGFQRDGIGSHCCAPLDPSQEEEGE